MGIPSFYRQLCRRFPALITKGVGAPPEWFCLDFNCAMYHVLRTMEPVGDNKKGWETKFCKAIATYMEKIIARVAPTKGIYVSCDGAVCAAKRRQQRLRRFKGPWAALMEAQVTGKPVDPNKWDQNALTPGSAFMTELGGVLVATGKRIQSQQGVSVVVSTTVEAGEGEHKLLAHMRLVRPVTCAIYGLDADLILLAMLLGADTGADVRLVREAQEFETAPRGAVTIGGAPSQWRSLAIGELTKAILGSGTGTSEDQVRDFVAAMSLLGNDFLPRSLTHTVRDDGIPELIAILRTHVWSVQKRLVDGGAIRREGLLAVMRAWALEEERDLVTAGITGRKCAGRHPGVGATPEETALREWNAQPARWATVAKILDPRDQNRLRANWPSIYASWHPGSAADYVQGVAWVWDYYSGRVVDQSWFFDQHLPPRWSDVAAHLETMSGDTVSAPVVQYPTPLPDWLHLLAVLPADSMRLLPPKAQRLMAQAPYYWPSSWSVYDVGKTQLWECEPVIPVIPEKVLRGWAV
jgi:5'-3' exonuclease